jgi:hypothetical protein
MHNRPIANSGFYRSVERNVINNPRVNNESLVKIDHMRGTNIVRQPSFTQPNNAGRGSSAVRRQGQISNNNAGQGSDYNGRQNRTGSVRRDAFPKTTPSSISTRSSVYSNQRGNSINNGNNAGNLRSGQTGTNNQRFERPATSQGANQSSGSQGSAIRNGGQQTRTQSRANSQQLGNYRNYKAIVEPRQANPASVRRETRSAPVNAAPSQRGGQAASGRGNQSKSTGGGRTQRNSR